MSKQKVNICLLSGNYFQRKSVINSIKESIPGHILYVYDEVDFEDLRAKVLENSFFEERRIFLVNSTPTHKWTSQKFIKNFIDLLPKVNQNDVLVLNNIKTSSKKLIDAISKIGKVFEFETAIQKKNIDNFIINLFKKNEKNIENDAVKILSSILSNNSSSVSADKIFIYVEKICNFMGNRKNVKLEDIYKVDIFDNEFVIWNLFELLDSKKVLESLKLINLFYTQSKNINADTANLISILLWRYRLLYMLKDGTEKGVGDESLANAIMNISKLNMDGSGSASVFNFEQKDGHNVPAYTEKYIMMSLRGNYYSKSPISFYSIQELLGAVYILQDCIFYIRSDMSDVKIKLILNCVIMAICKKIKYKDCRKVYSCEH